MAHPLYAQQQGLPVNSEVDDIRMHKIVNAEPESQPDDILEYDEDNVVVIDLTEERNSSSKFRNSEELAPMALHEVRYENYVDNETNQTIEIKREVYYDDSDLISPEEKESPKVNKDIQNQRIQQQLKNGGIHPDEEATTNGTDDDIVAPPSQFSTSSNLSDTTSDDNTQIAQANHAFTDEELDRLFSQNSGSVSYEPEIYRPPPHQERIQRGSTILNESELTWLNYQRYSQEEAAASAVDGTYTSEEEPSSNSAKKTSILPPVVNAYHTDALPQNGHHHDSQLAFNSEENQRCQRRDYSPDRPKLPSLTSTPLVASAGSQMDSDPMDEVNTRHRSNKKRSKRGRDRSVPEQSLPTSREGRRSASCKRDRPQTTAYNMSSSVCNTLQRRQKLISRGIVGRKAKSNDFLDQLDVSHTSTFSATLSQSNLVTKMTRIEKNLYLGSLEAATDVILLESHGVTHVISVDSVPLPRKITSMLPRIALLHLQVTDLPDEDLLSHFTTANNFIEECHQKGGACLVHCYRGRSRSATVVTAYLMHRHSYSLNKAIAKVRSKRPSISPHASFLAQLKLYEDMEFDIDPTNIQLKMFRLHCASERMRKAKILFRDCLDIVLDEDPSATMSGDLAQSSGKGHPMAYKCKRCRRTLATAFNLLPHCSGESPNWLDSKWALPAEEVLEGASDSGMDLCASSLFINPIRWMSNEIKANLSGKLYCPHCQAKVGNYSWVRGRECDGGAGCGAMVIPAFQLDVTEIIFRTKNKYLQSTGREPVVV